MRKLVQILGRNPVLALVDVALINAGFVLAFLLRFGADIRAHKVNLAEYVNVLPLVSLLAVLLFYTGSLYGCWQDRGRTDLVSAISTAIGGILISTMVLAFWKRQSAVPRTVLLLAIPLQLMLVSTARLLLQWLHQCYPDPNPILGLAECSSINEGLKSCFDRKVVQQRDAFARRSSLSYQSCLDRPGTEERGIRDLTDGAPNTTRGIAFEAIAFIKPLVGGVRLSISNLGLVGQVTAAI